MKSQKTDCHTCFNRCEILLTENEEVHHELGISFCPFCGTAISPNEHDYIDSEDEWR